MEGVTAPGREHERKVGDKLVGEAGGGEAHVDTAELANVAHLLGVLVLQDLPVARELKRRVKI